MNLVKLDDVCRICLRTSPHMVFLGAPLKDNPETDFLDSHSTIFNVLEQVISQKFISHGCFPSQICSTCRDSLIRAHEFRTLFFNSQSILESVLKEIDPGLKKNETSDMELVLGGEKFNLQDVFIVENEEESKDWFDVFSEHCTTESGVSVKKGNSQTDDVDFKENVDILESSHSESNVSIASRKGPTQTKKKTRSDKNRVPIVNTDIDENQCNVTNDGDEQKTKQKKRRFKQHTKMDINNTWKKRPILCDICGHINKGVQGAKKHRLTHSGRTFECKLCPKKFLYQMSLDLHMHGHQNIRKYLCTICGANFIWQASLKYHMRMHNNDRKFVCEYCSKNFYMQSAWKRHLRIHTNERPYICAFCQKGFRSNGEKRKHENIHTGNKPYKCQYCEKTFSSKYNLNFHYMSYPGEHACDYCSRTFKKMEFLKMHVKRKHHAEEPIVEKLPQ